MQITELLAILGGLALFLYGMRLMGEGLEHAAGSRLKSILEKLTGNRIMGMLVGLVLTVIIQSSSATTVMTVGFVNAGLMSLSQAVGVIMGANIGTTITGQLIALNMTEIAPIFAIIGIAVLMFSKRKTMRHIGEVTIGLGILFIGLGIMSESLEPLKDVPEFTNMLVTFGQNPLLGIIAGALFTAIVQSSSASIGVLQALAMQGLVSLENAIPIMLGMNMGTCITAGIASMGASKDAKRAALVHFLFNLIGTVLFMICLTVIPFEDMMRTLTPDNVSAQIANANTIFKVATMLVLLPFSNMLTKLSQFIIRDGRGKKSNNPLELEHIPTGVGHTAITMSQIMLEVDRMQKLSSENLHAALDGFFKRVRDIEPVLKREETIDYLNRAITGVLIELNASELAQKDSRRISVLFHVLSDIERIGDHAENIAEYALSCAGTKQGFSDAAKDELKNLCDMVYRILDESYAYFCGSDEVSLESIYALEQEIDDTTEHCRNMHIARMNRRECNADLGAVYVETLTDMERVADHALNIAQAAERI